MNRENPIRNKQEVALINSGMESAKIEINRQLGIDFNPYDHNIELLGLRRILEDVLEKKEKEHPGYKDYCLENGYIPGAITLEVADRFAEEFYSLDMSKIWQDIIEDSQGNEKKIGMIDYKNDEERSKWYEYVRRRRAKLYHEDSD